MKFYFITFLHKPWATESFLILLYAQGYLSLGLPYLSSSARWMLCISRLYVATALGCGGLT